ncbi:MAG: ABC-type dipeptide transport system, periplasmic component [Pseudonocardiales bacterium]|nr:ABC-type dipeptide transport system, periplasmic component [Pseudonocardiales bacterium]
MSSSTASRATVLRKSVFRRSRVVVAGASAALMLVAACSGASGGNSERGADTTVQDETVNGTLPTDGPAEDGGIMRVNVAGDAPTLDPMKSASYTVPATVTGTVYSKLVEFTTDRKTPYGSMAVHPDLAESYEQSKDGLTWTFKLRKGVKFQNIAPVNGREFTSADVKCTIDRIKSLPGVQKNLMDIVKSLDTTDPYTAVFNLTVPYAAFDETMASFYMPMLPCEGTSGGFDLAQTAIGTGPFILSEWKRKVEVNYVKNPTYFVAGKPHLDGFKIVIMSDPASAIAAMRTGELDYTGSVSETLLPTVLTSNPEMIVRNQIAIGPDQIMFNLNKKPFDDYRVRKAISMAFDRKAFGQTFYGDYFQITGPIPSTLFGGLPADEAEKLIPFDPAAAKKLLAEAGFPNGLTAEMLTTDGYGPQFVTQAQWVQQDLKEIGVNVTLKILDYATYFSTFGAKDYDIGWGLSTAFLTADEWLEALYVTGGPRNWFNTSDPKLDALINEQRSILDDTKRNEKLQEINKYILEHVLTPFMGIQYSALTVQQPWLHNLFTHPAYSRSFMVDVWLDKTAPTRK